MEKQLVENVARYDTIIFSTEFSETLPLFSGKTATLLRTAVFITEDYANPLPPNAMDLDALQMPAATHLAFDGAYIPFVAPQLTNLVISFNLPHISARHLSDILLHTPSLRLTPTMYRLLPATTATNLRCR